MRFRDKIKPAGAGRIGDTAKPVGAGIGAKAPVP
jgi:hypothetical protein